MSAILAEFLAVVDELESEREEGWQVVEVETETIIKENYLNPVKLPRQTAAPRRYWGETIPNTPL